jgi:hypothetical protein
LEKSGGEILKSGQSTRKRPVYVNGEYCESMTTGARKASVIIGHEVPLWEFQRMLNGQKKISGVTVSETPPEEKQSPVKTSASPAKKSVGPLLIFPKGEHPLDRGIRHWV